MLNEQQARDGLWWWADHGPPKRQPPQVKRKGPIWPWESLQLHLHEVSAIKAIPEATFAVIEKVCGLDRSPYFAGGEEGRRATDFAHGKAWAGNTLRNIRAMKLPSPTRSAPPDLPNSQTPLPATAETKGD